MDTIVVTSSVKKLLLVGSASLCISACQAQNSYEENYAPVDFLNYVDEDYIDILAIGVEKDTDSYEISLPYYEFPISKIKLGEACVFAVTKDLSRRWEDKAITDPKGGCDEQGDYLPSYYVTCEAARLIRKDTMTLHKKFDLYSFFIKKEDLNGPLEETSESGSSEYYEVQENSVITIYKYNGGRWKEVSKGVNSDIPRVFGEEYMENLVSGKTKNP